MFERKSHYSHVNMTADPSKYPQGIFKDKQCRWCNKEFKPRGPSHLYCSDSCKNESRTDQYYQIKYGISLKNVKELLHNQKGLCAICQKEGFKMHEGVFMNLNLDHCHESGNVRGLLCHNCNRALGLFKDDINIMKRAIDYLEGATTIRKE